MSYQQFIVTNRNPNDDIGGGGCVCDERKQRDCKGPFVVCYGNHMLDERSPHVVIGASCIAKMHEKLQGEVLATGAPGVNVEQAEPAPRRDPVPNHPDAVVVKLRDSEDPENAPPVEDDFTL